MSKAVTKKEKNPFKKEFDNFFDSPTRRKLEEFLKNHFGEQPECDFKENWQDFAKTAKHVLAIANSGSGCIIVGIAEVEDGLLETRGLTDFLDNAKIIDGLKGYLPSSLLADIATYNFDYNDDESERLKGKKFQVIIIEDRPEMLPFVAGKDGDKLREGAIYVRRGTSSVKANYEEAQKVINRRIATNKSSQIEIDLQTHLDQLKVLFGQLEKGTAVPKFFDRFSKHFSELIVGIAQSYEYSPNKLYPEEDFENFIVRLIKKKKRRIEIEIDVVNLSNEID